jgi:hypothetical protein
MFRTSIGALMESIPPPVHLNAHHRETVLHLFQHPVSHKIDWKDVVSLLEAIATVEETHKGKFLVTLGAETETFEPPRHKDIDAQQVVDLRRMLKSAGYEPDEADPPNPPVSESPTPKE